MMASENNAVHQVGEWMRNSLSLKLGAIVVLVLFLLIPASMIEGLIEERSATRNAAIREVTAKWANAQTLFGPVLSVPYDLEVPQQESMPRIERHYVHFLPDDLEIAGSVSPKKLHRSIYEVMVYRSDLAVAGAFPALRIPPLKGKATVQWEEAFLTFGVSDMRGIEAQVRLQWNGQEIPVKAGSQIPSLISTGMTVDLADLEARADAPQSFAFNLKLQGSQRLNFMPLGKETNVTLTSDWPHPGFQGAFLPDEREVTDQGFTASWKVLEYNRNYPQVFKDEQVHTLNWAAATFGTDLVLPVDDYQKAMRSAKYAIMTIALSFLVFFLVEVLNRRKIHAFQYTLVGLALCLFYTLLISLSEHLRFNLAYLISTVVIVGMIVLYSRSVFKKMKLSWVLFGVLVSVYTFMFVTLQLTDFALLLGSAGLTVILALTMYFTRHIDWYAIGKKEKTEEVV